MNTKVISFHYTLKDSTGMLLESSQGSEPLLFLEGAQNIIPGLESELLKMKVGEKQVIHVAAENAYGIHDKGLVMDVPIGQIPEEARVVGSQLQAQMEGHIQMLTVTAVGDLHVTVDGNHPLAGQDLSFDVEILEVRPATKEETLHGHVHGPGGHHHH